MSYCCIIRLLLKLFRQCIQIDKGISHCFKYMTLESYEDTLNNLELKKPDGAEAALEALVDSARDMKLSYHVGVVQSKDSFFGQHEPEKMPVSYELQNKWEAYLRMGCLASEMEGAALFTVGQYLRVRVGACFLVIANQERAKKGLSNDQVHDTGKAIELAVNAIRRLIEKDRG